ncbi:MAG: sugar transferase [bacterium]
MSRGSKRILLALSGHLGVCATTVLALWLAFSFATEISGPLWEMALLVTVGRLLYSVSRRPKPVLTDSSIRKRVWRVIHDEVYVSVFFLASAFALNWFLELSEVALFLLVNLVLQLALLPAVRMTLRGLAGQHRGRGRHRQAKQTIIVGTGPQARRVADAIVDSPELDTFLLGFLDFHRRGLWRYRDMPLLGGPDRLTEIISNGQVDALIIAVEPDDLPLTQPLFETAERMGVTVCLMSALFQPRLAGVRPGYISGLPALIYRAVPENQLALLAKALIDRLGALFGLLVTMPLSLAAAIWIKIDTRGPVLFGQTRCGVNGKPFVMYKFRTMSSDAERKKKSLMPHNDISGPAFKMKHDPRVTRCGRILRRYSIDEIPQFYNVLKGEMSLVGPRPPLPREVLKYEPWQHRKLSVKPGLTCLWQIGGRSNVDFERWMKLDLEYIDNWSLWLDARIMARTIPAVLKSDGAH